MDPEEKVNQTPEGGSQEQAVKIDAQGDAGQTAGKEEADGAGQQGQEEEGLKAAVVAEQKRRQQAEQQAKDVQVRMQLMQEELMRMQQGQTQQQVDPDGYPTWREIQQQQAQLVQGIYLQNLRNQYPDLDEVIGTNVGQAGYQPSEEVRKLVQANPSLAGIENFIRQGNAQAVSVAYQMAKQQKELSELRALKQSAEEQAKLKQANEQTNVMSPAAAGGAGGVSVTAQIPDVNSPEFDAYMDRLKAGEFDQS